MQISLTFLTSVTDNAGFEIDFSSDTINDPYLEYLPANDALVVLSQASVNGFEIALPPGTYDLVGWAKGGDWFGATLTLTDSECRVRDLSQIVPRWGAMGDFEIIAPMVTDLTTSEVFKVYGTAEEPRPSKTSLANS